MKGGCNSGPMGLINAVLLERLWFSRLSRLKVPTLRKIAELGKSSLRGSGGIDRICRIGIHEIYGCDDSTHAIDAVESMGSMDSICGVHDPMDSIELMGCGAMKSTNPNP